MVSPPLTSSLRCSHSQPLVFRVNGVDHHACCYIYHVPVLLRILTPALYTYIYPITLTWTSAACFSHSISVSLRRFASINVHRTISTCIVPKCFEDILLCHHDFDFLDLRPCSFNLNIQLVLFHCSYSILVLAHTKQEGTLLNLTHRPASTRPPQ